MQSTGVSRIVPNRHGAASHLAAVSTDQPFLGWGIVGRAWTPLTPWPEVEDYTRLANELAVGRAVDAAWL
jgi:hypothetical protein